jgi:hypothetical protein
MARTPLRPRTAIDLYQQLLQRALSGPADFGDLRLLRGMAPSDLDQQLLAQLEHRAFAREWGGGDLMRSLALLAMIPGYQGAKATGLMSGRTGTSDPWGQMGAGLMGMLEGWGR